MPARPPVRHKFGAKATVSDGIRFDSKREARYYDALKLRVAAGEVVFFLRQVPIHLPGGGCMRVDFLEFHADGTAHFVDAKGYATEAWKARRAVAEGVYPITIETV